MNVLMSLYLIMICSLKINYTLCYYKSEIMLALEMEIVLRISRRNDISIPTFLALILSLVLELFTIKKFVSENGYLINNSFLQIFFKYVSHLLIS